MDLYIGLYTRFSGRLGRQRFWLAMAPLVLVGFGVALLVPPLFGLNLIVNPALVAASSDPGMGPARLGDAIRGSALTSLGLLILFAWPAMAVMVKRRHDRDAHGFEVYALFALLALSLTLQAGGWSYDLAPIRGVLVPQPTVLGSLINIAVAVLAIFLFVVLGILPGLKGTTRFGPPPSKPSRQPERPASPPEPPDAAPGPPASSAPPSPSPDAPS